jgi:mono/diheme cytochrome c family protein
MNIAPSQWRLGNMIQAFCAFILTAATLAAATVPSMDSDRGRQLFESQNCIRCHSLNGQGGKKAPDLGRLIDRGFTPEMLAGTMWNHAPAMWNEFREQGIALSVITPQNSADLFAAFYSAHFFDLPSDAARGKALFSSKSCGQCHGIGKAILPAAKPANEWEAASNAVALVAAMSNHTSAMRAELAAKKISWPVLTGADIGNLLIFVRNLPGSRSLLPVFKITAGDEGAALFHSKGCAGCHAEGALHTTGRDLNDISAALWNHAANPKVSPVRFEQSEMSALLGYVWAQPFFANPGSFVRGAAIFRQRRCMECHGASGSGAPDLLANAGTRSGITMVSALWLHGPAMLTEMNRKGVPWPRFKSGEMSDLIAYLNAGKIK